MLVKYIMTGLAGSVLLAGAVVAQTPTATSDKTTAASEQQFKGDWRASKVVGLRVYNESNENVGSINDLLMDKSGNIKAAVIGVGGFLGMGEHLVAVTFDKIKFVDEPVAYSGASGTGAPGSPNAPGSRPPSSTTTGSTSSNAPANTAKPNPWYP